MARAVNQYKYDISRITTISAAMSSPVVIVSVILGLVILFVFCVFSYVFCCFIFVVDDNEYTFTDLWKGVDLEMGQSIAAMKSIDSRSTKIALPLTSGVVVDETAPESAALPPADNHVKEELPGNSCSSRVEGDINFSTTFVSSNLTNEEYDSMNKTLMLQDLNKTSIKSVKDPYLENDIVVGGIVVLVKPYETLKPGDLIRVVQFIMDGKTIECYGIILNTYIESINGNLCLKLRENNYELMKQVPLNCISLETTVLSNY